MMPILPTFRNLEMPEQKFERVMGNYLKEIAKLLNSQQLSPKDFTSFIRSTEKRDKLLESHPELLARWEKIREEAGVRIFLNGQLHSKL